MRADGPSRLSWDAAEHPDRMEPSPWLPWRWPLTALALGGLATYSLVRLTSHPIQVHVQHGFSEPLQLSGSVNHRLVMQGPVQAQLRALAPLPMTVAVHQDQPIGVRVEERTPLQVQVSNETPVQVQVLDTKPIEVDVEEKSPVKIKLGF